MIPQIIIISLAMIGLFFVAHKHGKEKKEKYNFWVTLSSTVIEIAILAWGGFFDNIFK